MLDSRDFVDIRFQDNARYKKPIGIYWLQAASVGLVQTMCGTCRRNVIWPYRLPSLVAAVASVVLTGAIGTCLFTVRIGFVAGILLALSLVLNFEARVATTDATMLACTLIVQYVIARLYRRSQEGDAPLAIGEALAGWGALGLGILVKGPIILLIVFGTFLGLAVFREDLRWLRKLRSRIGLSICLFVVAPWLLLITLRSQGAFLQDSVGQDLLGKVFNAETAGRAPPGFHALMFWIGFWPGSLVVLLAIPWIWTNRRESAIKFCLAWAVPAWIAFELPMTKLFHYVLPLYPALALLGAAWLVRNVEPTWSPSLRNSIVFIWSAATVFLCCALVALPVYVEGRLLLGPALLGLMGLSGLIAISCLNARQPMMSLMFLVASGWALILAVALAVPELKTAFISERILAAIPVVEGCPRPSLVSSGFEEPSLVFMSSTDVRFLAGSPAADAAAASPCVLSIIERREEQVFLKRSAELGRTPRPLTTFEGLNYTNSRWIKLTLYSPSLP